MRNRIFITLLLTLSLTSTTQIVFAQNTVQQLFKQGETAEAVGNNSQAETIWRKILRVEPNNGKAYNNLGNALRRQGKLAEALAAHQKALQINHNDAEAYVGIGNVLNAQGKPEEALAYHKKALQLNPKLAIAYNGLGITLSDQKKLDEAVTAYQKAIEFDPKYAAAYYNLGIALYDQKKLDEAVTAYQKAIELDPKDASAYNNLGNALSDQKKLDGAVAAYQKAIEFDPKYATAYYNLGIALYYEKKLDGAVTAYQKAIEFDPKYAIAYNNLGNALYYQKKLDGAVTAYQKAIELDPNYAIAYNNLGNALSDQKKLDEAVAAYQKAIELDPKLAIAYYNLGNALSDQKKLDEAVAAYQKAIELDPKYATAYNNLGNALRDQKKLDAAISNYKKALSLPEDTLVSPTTAHTLANNNLGVALQELILRLRREAIEHFDKAEELDPNYIYASNNNIEARKLWSAEQDQLASLESDIEFLPKNDPNLPVKRSVVRITAKFSNNQRQGIEVGTGVVIQRNANRTLILTGRHVIFDGNDQGKNIQVEFFSVPPANRVRMRRNAKLLKMTSTENKLDLAVLEISGKLPEDIQPLSMSTTIDPIMPIQIIGHDAQRGEDKSWSVKSGKIIVKNQELEISETELRPGYSGSPVIDSKNRLIAIVYARKPGETRNFAYPISQVKKQLSIWKITLTK
ncbi:tetratricopeptide repeat protein [Aphanizomenon flos-aquae FACHB-1416]|uniref:serine protease n=1 Tax=Aphanizomenon flos-aquae TaxID=1176 RepID=UPI0016870A77|nr:serine protease [Aphanizomenon flos-aquae]MBD2673937.1 tetratricopeptide repeat protein [Aphanizomenon flos-aquae FACHB-1416]